MIELKQIEANVLDRYVAVKHPEANFLQTSTWAAVYEKSGFETYNLGFYDGKKLIGAAVAILKRAKRATYLEVPGGPLIDWSDEKVARESLVALKRFAKTKRCVFVRMRPNVLASGELATRARALGLIPSPMHLHAQDTVMLDLTQDEEQLLASMRRQTRYEVRRAQKLGIVVTSSSEEEAFNQFYAVQLETAKRQGFIPSSRDFILNQHRAFGDQAKIYKAELDGEIIAMGLILLQSPEAIYHEAASTDLGRKLPGAYALQWQVIRDARAAGLKRYNLFGIAPENAKHHRYAGVTTFKTGFGGERIAYLPAQDLVIARGRYAINYLFESLRRRMRHL